MCTLFSTRFLHVLCFMCAQDGYLSYFQDQEEAEVYRSETDSQLHHHPSSQRQLSLDCVEAVRTEVSGCFTCEVRILFLSTQGNRASLSFAVVLLRRLSVVCCGETAISAKEWMITGVLRGVVCILG